MCDKEPFISIVMPIYNAAEYLNATLQSVAKQKFTDFEVIMVDDCSKDESFAIGMKWQTADPRFRIIKLEQNGGAGHARNVGIDYANGTYLAFIDADDTIDEALMQAAVDSLRFEQADQVVWGVTENYYNDKEELVEQNKLSLETQSYTDLEELKKIVIKLEQQTLFGYQWNRLYRLRTIKENQIRFKNTLLYEDYFFNLEVIKHTRSLNVINKTGYYYNKRMNQSLTSKYVKEYFALSHRRVESMFQLYRNWEAVNDEVVDILGNIYFRYILSGLARNCDKRSGYDLGRRRNWIGKVKRHDLYKQIGEYAKLKSPILRVLQMMLNHNFLLGCLILGRSVYIIKDRYPLFFALRRKNQVY